MKKKRYTEADIRSLSQKEWLKLHFFDQLTIDYNAFIKGVLLNPPIAKVKNENTNVIHWFFVNEHEVARLFTNACREYLNTLQLPDDLSCAKTPEGFSIVASHALAEHMRTIDFEEKVKIVDPKTYITSDKTLDWQVAFSYLLGKYIRFYYDGKFVLLNNGEQFIVQEIISMFSLSSDTITTRSLCGTSPQSTQIHLNEDSFLLENLEHWRSKWL